MIGEVAQIHTSPTVAQCLGIRGTTYLKTFYRVFLRGQIYYSEKYGRTTARNSFTITYRTPVGATKYGQIQYYILYNGPQAVIRELTPMQPPSSLQKVPHIVPCALGTELDIIPVQNITEKCVFLLFSGSTGCYVVWFPRVLVYD